MGIVYGITGIILCLVGITMLYMAIAENALGWVILALLFAGLAGLMFTAAESR